MKKHSIGKKKSIPHPMFKFRCTPQFKANLAAVATLESRTSSALAKKVLADYIAAHMAKARAERRKKAQLKLKLPTR